MFEFFFYLNGCCASMQLCKYASMQVYKYAIMLVCKYADYASTQVSLYASTLGWKDTSTKVCRWCKYVIMQIKQICKYPDYTSLKAILKKTLKIGGDVSTLQRTCLRGG